MQQVTAILRDCLGHPVINEEFAAQLARGAGFSLLPHLTPLDESLTGEWQVRVPSDLLHEGDVQIPVDFPNTEIPIGLVSVYAEPVQTSFFGVPWLGSVQSLTTQM